MYKTLYVDNLKYLKVLEKVKLLEFSYEDLIKLSKDDIKDFLKIQNVDVYSKVSLELIEKQVKFLEKINASCININSPLYPVSLKKLSNPPFAIYFKGHMPSSAHNALAIVGSRKVDRETAKITQTFAGELARNNFNVISGFAIGVDREAHIGAIKMKKPTFAVLGGPLDYVYPKENRLLIPKILESQGALLTEVMPFSQVKPYFFAHRNRIIASLVNSILITYAGEKSGALITANFALKQKKDVFVYKGKNQGRGVELLLENKLVKVVNSPFEIYDILNVKNKIEKVNREEIKDSISLKLVDDLTREIKGEL